MDGPNLLPLFFSSRAGERKRSLSIPVRLSFPCPWRRVLARTVGPRRSPSSEPSSSTRESGTLPGDRRRRPRTCWQCAHCARGSRGARPELGAVVLWSTRTKGSRFSLSFSFIGFYVQMTVGRRLSGYVELCKCCRVSTYSGKFFSCIVFCWLYILIALFMCE